MRERRRSGRRLALTTAVIVAIGVLLLSADAASASLRTRAFPVIKFSPVNKEVTLEIPPACPASHPACVWVLSVDEPDSPARTVVGNAMGTSGVLTVAYPTDFCGPIQADATVGPAPFRLLFGHKATIQTGSCVDGTAALPLTDSPSTSTPTDAATVAKATPAQLPFTGVDYKSLAVVGMALIMLGLTILTTLEQRRSALRRAGCAVRSHPAGIYASRASRWFWGD